MLTVLASLSGVQRLTQAISPEIEGEHGEPSSVPVAAASLVPRSGLNVMGRITLATFFDKVISTE